MYLKFQPFFIIAESPVHAGSGSELGTVDLLIQRERYTNFPKIEGSGLKGCIREAFANYLIENRIKENNKEKITFKLQPGLKEKIGERLFNTLEQEWKVETKDKTKEQKEIHYIKFHEAINLVFGPEEGEAHAGAISFTDAKILLFPVKSLKGVFAWITCPIVLNRFIEDMKIAKKDKDLNWNFTNLANTIPEQTSLLISGKVILEEYTYEVKENNETSKIAEWLSKNVFPSDTTYNYWRDKLVKDLVILSDDDFKEFVSTSTEVITRTKIDTETGTVQSGALWTEEYLPQDTILYSIAMASPVRVRDGNQKGILKGNTSENEAKNVIEFLKQGIPQIIQIGGNQTTGKGLVRIKFLETEGRNGK